VGSYAPNNFRLDNSNDRASIENASARLTLAAGRIATLERFPEFDDFGQFQNCEWTGTATWSVSQEANESWQVRFTELRPAPESHSTCAIAPSDMFFSVLGKSPAHTLYLVVGDPDSGTGIEFSQKQN
jgi:hypothetical protein